MVPWWGLILGVLPFFAGCTTLTHKNIVNTIVTEPAPSAADAKSANFSLIGRASVKGGKESFSGGVQWRHAEGEDEILLLSPLGQTLVQIRRTSEGVYLTTSEQEDYYAADVESLTERVLGWRLPLTGLQYWVQGMNSPATASAIDVAMDGRVVAIRQDGWEIDYSSYFPPPLVQTMQTQTLPEQAVRPKSLLLKRSGLQIKLVIDAWNPGNH
ncbi:MAG: lipoprotein insertase outer membrane protein LolB [Nitrosospira sp.]|nr:lipoprotein insertase outer membrane protein LolB [Nitrosospira sp.]